MTAAVERGMRVASVGFARDVLAQLSKEGVLTCTLEQALGLFDFDSVSIVSSRSKASKKRESKKNRGGGEKKSNKVTITPKPTVLLPFCGVVMTDWCAGVKFNHGLHTQCTQGRCNGDRYCKTCRKHADNSATGKPPYGDIEDRANHGVDYRDPKGKLTMPYANVAEKLGISMDAAHAAAATLKWTIPAEQLVKRVSKRGRPAKSAAVSDTDSEDGEAKTAKKKKRGRPNKPKAKPVTQEDQIAQLVAEAYAETATAAPKKVAKKVVKKVKKAKKPKMTAEEKEAAKLAKQQEKEAAKLAKKEAAEKLKAEKKATKDAEKAAAKLAKKEAAEKVKAEKKAAKEAEKLLKQQEKAAAKLAKQEAATKLKAEKLAAKKLEQEQKAAAKATAKAAKLAAAKAKAAAKKKSKTAQLKVPIAEVKAVEQEDLFLGTDDVEAAQASVVAENAELEFEVINDAADSSDDEDEGIELSETMTVGGVEYFFSEQDGQTILFSKSGEPVGIYDAETETVQECEFDDE
jgi:hypothetical protein